MSLPLIDYENIKYNYEFKDFLEKKYPILFSWLNTTNSNLSEIPREELRQILKLYKQFAETKMICFKKTTRKEKSLPISDDQLRTWLESRTAKHPQVEEYIRKKIINILFLEFKDLNSKFPEVIKALYFNHQIKINILPFEKYKDYKFMRGGAAYIWSTRRQGRLIANIYCFDTLGNVFSEAFKMMLKHEFYHLVDIVVGNPEAFGYYKGGDACSQILDRRLNGKWKFLGERQVKNCEKALKEFRSLEACSTKYSKEKEREVLKKNNCWAIISKQYPGYSISSSLSQEPKEFLITELFVFALMVYFEDKDLIKLTDPEMYEIIEKEILPYLR